MSTHQGNQGDKNSNSAINCGGLKLLPGQFLTVPGAGADLGDVQRLLGIVQKTGLMVRPPTYDSSKSFTENVNVNDQISVTNLLDRPVTIAVLPRSISNEPVDPTRNPAVLARSLGGMQDITCGNGSLFNCFADCYEVTLEGYVGEDYVSRNFTVDEINGREITVRTTVMGSFSATIGPLDKQSVGSYRVTNLTHGVLYHKLTPVIARNKQKEIARMIKTNELVEQDNVPKFEIARTATEHLTLPGGQVKVYVLGQSPRLNANNQSLGVRPLPPDFAIGDFEELANFDASPGNTIVLAYDNDRDVNGLIGSFESSLRIPSGRVNYKNGVYYVN